jgi:hypothetical protein
MEKPGTPIVSIREKSMLTDYQKASVWSDVELLANRLDVVTDQQNLTELEIVVDLLRSKVEILRNHERGKLCGE